MKFRTHIDSIRQRVLVYCEVGVEDGLRVFTTRSSVHTPGMIYKVQPGDEPPIWDWFPLEVVDALGEVLAPRPAASERHLDDAISVRDRLLSLIEDRELR